ncbi:uncharacterized protein N7459_001795 [Penicillium hispanicum]|uniref:uncharacterized protein n=1 Tax=Penicillium hispanicum TaxID=1080232 RepID=UPI0025409E68|nr:uncharacterized protein N7459_001795 [Penicillium hispanicum]KAJ5595587.1 hypothetical protein N7459_001795 [Penicillium hispanicum]
MEPMEQKGRFYEPRPGMEQEALAISDGAQRAKGIKPNQAVWIFKCQFRSARRGRARGGGGGIEKGVAIAGLPLAALGGEKRVQASVALEPLTVGRDLHRVSPLVQHALVEDRRDRVLDERGRS